MSKDEAEKREREKLARDGHAKESGREPIPLTDARGVIQYYSKISGRAGGMKSKGVKTRCRACGAAINPAWDCKNCARIEKKRAGKS